MNLRSVRRNARSDTNNDDDDDEADNNPNNIRVCWLLAGKVGGLVWWVGGRIGRCYCCFLFLFYDNLALALAIPIRQRSQSLLIGTL